jgi:hypothetical protein
MSTTCRHNLKPLQTLHPPLNKLSCFRYRRKGLGGFPYRPASSPIASCLSLCKPESSRLPRPLERSHSLHRKCRSSHATSCESVRLTALSNACTYFGDYTSLDNQITRSCPSLNSYTCARPASSQFSVTVMVLSTIYDDPDPECSRSCPFAQPHVSICPHASCQTILPYRLAIHRQMFPVQLLPCH